MPENAAAPLRIFIEPGGYRWGNLGDTMMLEAALGRLRSFWPDAGITVHCLDEERLRLFDPSAVALDPSSSRRWNRIPRFLRPAAARVAAPFGGFSKSRRLALLAEYLHVLRSADLVLLSGAGSLNDSFKEHALAVLETIDRAIDGGTVTAMMGQGIGPMSDAALRDRAAEVLPRVDFIASREGLSGPPLLQSMGVAQERVTVTGDDAIPLAYAARPQTLGPFLGVNLRSASYSQVDGDLVRGIARVLREAAAGEDATLVPVPISRYRDEDDVETFGRMFGQPDADVTTPAELLRIVAQCRIVVTGSYHAGVLALSMGIPAVAVAASAYYATKFRGLAAQFGPACRVELTSHPDFYARLRSAVGEAWESAETTRGTLLDAAAGQIALQERAYRHVFELVNARRGLRRRL